MGGCTRFKNSCLSLRWSSNWIVIIFHCVFTLQSAQEVRFNVQGAHFFLMKNIPDVFKNMSRRSVFSLILKTIICSSGMMGNVTCVSAENIRMEYHRDSF